MKRTLLLNNDYDPLTFLAERRVFRFLAKDKVEVISVWDDHFYMNGVKCKFPATLRLKTYIRKNYRSVIFSKNEVIKRDKGICQFCGKHLSPNKITIDHIVPKSRGGENSFYNCVVACFECNNKKNNLLLDEAGMKLLKKPEYPKKYIRNVFDDKIKSWHEDWNWYYDRYKIVNQD